MKQNSEITWVGFSQMGFLWSVFMLTMQFQYFSLFKSYFLRQVLIEREWKQKH